MLSWIANAARALWTGSKYVGASVLLHPNTKAGLKILGKEGSKRRTTGKVVMGGLMGLEMKDKLLGSEPEQKARNLLVYGHYVTDEDLQEMGDVTPGRFIQEYAEMLGEDVLNEDGSVNPDSLNKVTTYFIEKGIDQTGQDGGGRNWAETASIYLAKGAEMVDALGIRGPLFDKTGITEAVSGIEGFEVADPEKIYALKALENARKQVLGSQAARELKRREIEKSGLGELGEELIGSSSYTPPSESARGVEEISQLKAFKDDLERNGPFAAVTDAQTKYPAIRKDILKEIRNATAPDGIAGEVDSEAARVMLSSAGYLNVPAYYPRPEEKAKAPAPAPPSTIAKPTAAPAAPATAAAAPVAEQVRAQAGQPESGPSYADVLANPGGFTRGERYDALVGGKPPQMSEEEVLNAVAPTRGMTKGQRMDYYDQTLSPPSFSVATAGRGVAEGKPEAPQPQQSVQDAVRNAPETPVSRSGFMTGGSTQMPTLGANWTLGGKYVHGFLRPSDWQDYNAEELEESYKTGKSPQAVRMERHIASKRKESADRGMEVFNRLFRPKTTAAAPAAQAAPGSAPAAQPAPQARPAPQNYGDLLSGITPEQNAKLDALPPPTMLSTGPTFSRSGVGASLPGLSMPPASPLTPGLPEGFPSERNLSSIDGTSAGDIGKFWRGSGPKKTAMPSASGYMRPMWEGTTNYFDPEAERLRPSNFTRKMKVRMPQAGIERPNFK